MKIACLVIIGAHIAMWLIAAGKMIGDLDRDYLYAVVFAVSLAVAFGLVVEAVP